MKRFVLLLALLALILSGCAYEDGSVMNRANSYVERDTYDMVITEHYDGGQNLIQRTEYNKNTKITIVYTYHWGMDGLLEVCTGATITTIGSDGSIVSTTTSVPKG